MPRYVLMDPNLTLLGIQQLIKDVREWPAAGMANDLADRVEALDEHLRNAGFGVLPEAWRHAAAAFDRGYAKGQETSEAEMRTVYEAGREDGAQEGFASGYSLAQSHMHTHLLNHGYTGDH